jgi:hypothetical protein
MKQVDRNFFDMERKINIQQYNLDLINGFSTAIASYENQLLLCAELTHKLLHANTIHGMMERFYNESNRDMVRFEERCLKEFVGRIVMTK